MAIYPRIVVSGVDLTDPAGRWGIDPSQPLRVGPGRRSTSVAVPGRSGVLWPRTDSRDVGSFSINLIVAGAPAADRDGYIATVEAALDGLFFLFDQPSIMVDYYASATDIKRAECRTISSSVDRVGSDAARVTFVLEIPDAFWHSTTADVFTRSSADGSVTGGSVEVTTLSGSTAPIIDAQLMIKGPFLKVSAADAVTGQKLTYSGPAVTAAQYLRIDCLSMVAQIIGAPDWTGTGVDVTAYVLNTGTNSDFSWLNLNPGLTADPVAARPVTMQWIFTGLNSATQWQVKARKAFL